MLDGNALACVRAQVEPDPDEGVALETSQQLSLAPHNFRVLEQLRRVVHQETAVLLTGEPGTGKTHLARLIHDLSPRRHKPFLVVDCPRLDPAHLGSELLGHLQGAFPGAETDCYGKLAEAAQGTLLLREVGALPLPVQTRLLPALEEHVFEPLGANAGQPLRARLMATTSAPLQVAVLAGKFRAELLGRLNIVSICLPSLRDCGGAVTELAVKSLEEYAARYRPDVCCFARQALQALQLYPWPGNLRELQSVVQEAVACCQGPEVLLSDLPEVVRCPLPRGSGKKNPGGRTIGPSGQQANALARSYAAAETLRISQALRNHDNNRARAAAELGISRMSLYKKLRKYGLGGN
jgi:DNA-binding NtrC family response regulator